jgi:hypothetical protein
MPSIIAGDTNRADIFLDRGSYNIVGGPVIAKIDHLDSMPDQLEIDRIDGAIMPVTNWHGSQDPDRFHSGTMRN